LKKDLIYLKMSLNVSVLFYFNSSFPFHFQNST
jgi:hypothetical protein